MNGRSYTVCKSDTWSTLIRDAGETLETAFPHVNVRLKGRYSPAQIVRIALTLTTTALTKAEPTSDRLDGYAERYLEHAETVEDKRGGFRLSAQSRGEAEWLLEYLTRHDARVPKMPLLYAIFVALQYAIDECRVTNADG